MSKLSDLAGDEVRKRVPAQAKEATVRSDAAHDTDPVYVSIDVQGSTYRRGPCPGWQPRPDDRWPQVGDAALVIESDHRQPWIIAWWPADA